LGRPEDSRPTALRRRVENGSDPRGKVNEEKRQTKKKKKKKKKINKKKEREK